jgi:hypothetical protein
MGRLEVTLVLDADEDVCRIGFGELAALQLVHDHARVSGFYVRSQPGLRVGVLLADEQTLVWSPTPRSVEAAPDSRKQGASTATSSPNGLLLGANPGAQIAQAVCAEGTETDPAAAEIGTAAVTPRQVKEVATALTNNPLIPVDLARVTRVFSTKLQFVELKVTRAKLSQQQITLSSAQLNADASEHLRGLLESKLKAFSEFRDKEVQVPVFIQGEPAFRANGEPMMEYISEAGLNRERHAIEVDFLYDLPGFGRVMERARQLEFKKRINAYEVRLLAHSEEMRKTLASEAETIIKDAVQLIAERMARSEEPRQLKDVDRAKLVEELRKTLARAETECPTVNLVFKEVTYEQTQDGAFKAKLDKALPPAVKRRLGDWYEKFTAARQATGRDAQR